MRLSFIIPYNSNRYLSECIDSLYKQDISEDEYEIVAVNDCSTDNTKEILLEYQLNHKNFRIINHEQNKGQGGARNTGLKYSTGEYIWYIDHDDFISPNSLSFLLNLLEQDQLDFLQFYYTRVDEKSRVLNVINTGNFETKVISGLEFVRSLGENFLNSYNMSVWARLYKRKFLVDGKFQFEEIAIFEDLAYSLSTLLFAEKIKIIEKHLYFYRVHSVSTMQIFEKTVKGDFTYFSCIMSGLSIVELGTVLITNDILISQMIIEGGIWRINSITKPLLKATKKERVVFYTLLNSNKVVKKSIQTYLNPINKFLINYEVLSKPILSIITLVLNLVRKS